MRAVMLCLLFVNVFADVYMHNPRGRLVLVNSCAVHDAPLSCSNDRNCERNVNRKNGNRLFDSQNNAKVTRLACCYTRPLADSSFLQGGYACPRAVGGPEIKENNMYPVSEHTVIGMKTDQNRYYYAGSTLAVQWTNQHGCGGNSNVNCEIVLQYMY